MVLLLSLLGVSDVLAEGYRVILKNGSWVHARVEPARAGEKTHIELIGGGVAVRPAAAVDWPATDRWNAQSQAAPPEAAQPKPARPVPKDTITLVGEVEDRSRAIPEGGAAEAVPAGASPSVEAADASGQPARYSRLEAALEDLRREKRELEQSAANQVNLDEAAELRDQAAVLDRRIKEIVSEQRNLAIAAEETTAEVGEDVELQRRLRFLNVEIPRLLREKQELDSQAATLVNLDQARAVREQAAALDRRIRAHEAERKRLQSRSSQDD